MDSFHVDEWKTEDTAQQTCRQQTRADVGATSRVRASAGLQQGLPRVPGCRAVTTLLWPPRELQTRARELGAEL